jgi:FtsH-binding integral membrane protein
MNKTFKTVVVFSLITVFLGFFLQWLIEEVLHQPVFRFNSFLPVLFYFSGLGLIFGLRKYAAVSSSKQVNFFLLLKFLKMLVWGMMALIYVIIIKIPIKPFVITFAIYYLLLLIFETFAFYNAEKHHVHK